MSLFVPREPNTVSIPKGTVRRFHVTSPDNVSAILNEGLLMRRARGIEGPRAIYSWPTYREAESYGMDAPIVEFWMPANAYDDNPYATFMEAPPEQIIAIHEPWHGHYRYALENNLSSGELRGIDSDYEKAADALKQIGKNPLVFPKHMSEWMLDSKVNAVVTMHPDTFLDLTTNGLKHKLAIRAESQSLDEYNRYAAEKKTQIPPFLKINIDPYDLSYGKVVSHEGRHRAAALLNNGEQVIPVALILARDFVPSRQYTVLDMPLRWEDEHTGRLYIASEIIGEILHSNVQEQYQKDAAPDMPMTVEEYLDLTQERA